MSGKMTLSCRLRQHEHCQGFMYWGSIFGDPTPCPCYCHEADWFADG